MSVRPINNCVVIGLREPISQDSTAVEKNTAKIMGMANLDLLCSIKAIDNHAPTKAMRPGRPVSSQAVRKAL